MTDEQPTPPSASLPLFYKTPMPLEPSRYPKAGLNPKSDYSFARDTNAIALTLSEFALAARHYPIVFSALAPVIPFAVLGVRDNENLFIEKNGQWKDDLYVPAYVRRYPFIFSEVPNSDRLVLCVDESAAHFEQDSTQPFFIDGKPSENLKRALQFNEMYHANLQDTRAFGEWLDANGMLEEKMARAEMPNGQSYTLRGFRLLNTEKTRDLKDEQVLELHKRGWLPLLHFHLQSLSNWANLSKMVAQLAA
jgi:hypothetical protein